MSDRSLLLIAVAVASLNAIASIVRTVWHYEKRRAWRQKNKEK